MCSQFSLELSLKTDIDQAQNLGWGGLTLRINGEMVWFHQKENESRSPVYWNWVDLLIQLSKSWTFLMSEVDYPLGLSPESPLDLRKLAEARWEGAKTDDDIIFKEDDEICRFEKRHNLASGLRGLYLPSVHVVRDGEFAWVCVQDDHGNDTVVNGRFSFADVRAVLTDFGDKIAEHLKNSTHPRSLEAAKDWINAKELFKDPSDE